MVVYFALSLAEYQVSNSIVAAMMCFFSLGGAFLSGTVNNLRTIKIVTTAIKSGQYRLMKVLQWSIWSILAVIMLMSCILVALSPRFAVDAAQSITFQRIFLSIYIGAAMFYMVSFGIVLNAFTPGMIKRLKNLDHVSLSAISRSKRERYIRTLEANFYAGNACLGFACLLVPILIWPPLFQYLFPMITSLALLSLIMNPVHYLRNQFDDADLERDTTTTATSTRPSNDESSPPDLTAAH